MGSVSTDFSFTQPEAECLFLLLWHLRAQKQLGLGFTCCFFLLVSPMALLSQQGSLQHRGKQKARQDRDPSGQGPIGTGTHQDRDPSHLTPGPGKIPRENQSIPVAAPLPAASRPEEFLLPLLAPAPAPASPPCPIRPLQPWHWGHSHQLQCRRSWGHGVAQLLGTPWAALYLNPTTGFMTQSIP